VETGHGKQVLAVLTDLRAGVVDTEAAGGRKLIGVPLSGLINLNCDKKQDNLSTTRYGQQ